MSPKQIKTELSKKASFLNFNTLWYLSCTVWPSCGLKTHFTRFPTPTEGESLVTASERIGSREAEVSEHRTIFKISCSYLLTLD